MKRLALLLLCGLASVVSSDAANIVFVSFHADDNIPSTAAATAGFTMAPDMGYTQLLRNNGHTVTRVVSSDIPVAAVLNAADLVIISRSVPSGHYELDAETAAWNGITAPTIILGGYVLRSSRLGYTTGTTIPDTTGTVRLRALVPNHPIFAGVSFDSRSVMVNPYANIASYTNTPQRGISVNNNPVAGGGTVLATIGTAGDPAVNGMVIGEWLTGAAMGTSPSDTLGGHRLVLLTGSRENAAITGGAPALTSEAAGIYDLDTDGARLLLNAVSYMTSGRISIVQVNTVNNESPGPNETSLLEALTDARDGDYVRFNIPGAGPHVIQTPLGGYPLITANGLTIDGSTQPGSVPNTNPILGGNNAQLKIVLDSTGAETAPNPVTPALPLRRSTRLDFPDFPGNTGYGSSENGMLAIFGADNCTVRGLSFIARRTAGSDEDPSIYAVALVREATNSRVQGCWFGVQPGAGNLIADVKPPASAVAAFRWRIGGDVYSAEAKVGTDGDGVNDRAEFNVMVGGRISLAIEAPRLRVAGNYVNTFPDGLHFVDLDANYQLWQDAFSAGGSDPSDVTIENMENGRVTDDSVIGTNGDGVGDADERNVFASVVYSHLVEFYSSGNRAVIAGNYFGVGIDGVTPAPLSTNISPDFVEFPGTASIRVGSNGDGVSDDLEGNLILNGPGSRCVVAGGNVPIVGRLNRMVNNQYAAVPFAESQTSYTAYYAPYLNDSSAGAVPLLLRLTNNVLSGTFPAPNATYPNTIIDVYLVDATALANTNYWPKPVVHPRSLLGSYQDNGAGELNPAANEFSINLSSFGLSPTTYVTVAVSYSQDAGSFNAGRAVTSPMSNPISARPTLAIRLLPETSEVEVSWLGARGGFVVQVNDDVTNSGNWFEVFNESYNDGRNILALPFEPGLLSRFFRLLSQ